MNIRAIKNSDLKAIAHFCDNEIGKGYYQIETLIKYIYKPACSFILLDENEKIVGVRLTVPPQGLLELAKTTKLSPELWKTSLKDTGYFQSLFIAPEFQKQGWGSQLSAKSIEVLKSQGCKAVVCHSWKESPNSSSLKYLKSTGFEEVHEHENFWYDRDYTCPRCGRPCLCTAIEMIRYF